MRIARNLLNICNNGLGPLGGSRYVVGLDVGVDGRRNEQDDDEGSDDGADYLKAYQPLLVVPANGLEHAPETVVDLQRPRRCRRS